MKISQSHLATLILAAIALGISACSQENNNNLALEKTKEVKQYSSSNSSDKSRRSLSPNFSCFNVNALGIKSWQNPKFIDAVKQLNPRILRVPGGNVANYWDWEKGGLIEDDSNLPAGLPDGFRSRKRREYTNSKLEDIKAGMDAIGATPLFVLNMISSDLESQLEMLRSAKELGMPVKYVELGNEFFFGNKNFRQAFPTPADYAKTASEWISAIKKEFPDAEISIIGATGGSQIRHSRIFHWNESLLNSALPKADAITIHRYHTHGLDQGKIEQETYPYFSAEDVPIILGQPFKKFQKLHNDRNFNLIPQNKKIWLTEYNLIEDIFFGKNKGKKPKVMGSWAHGMYALAMGMLFLEEPRIEFICNHVLVGNVRFGAIFRSKGSFLDLSETAVATPLSVSAAGSALRLLHDATEGMTAAQKIDFPNNPTLTGSDDFKYSALYGWMFTNDERSRAIIMNLSDRDINIDLSSLFSQTVNYEQISGDPRLLVTKPGILTENNGSASGTISLPAYSVTKLF
ncbi:MAG: hypothetical protein QNJ54_00110 [Prochloraceae cyanobacterium]|nr:hypothetical protein [Prochloraceae cyanobacterium]